MTEKTPPETPNKNPIKINRRGAILIGSFVILILFCICGSLFNFTKFATQAISGSGLENIDISVYTPIIVKKGEIFDLEVTIVNNSEEPVTIATIGVGQGFLDGIELVRTQPRFLDRQRLDIWGREFNTFIFSEVIRPNETVVIKMESEAIEVGDFSDLVPVCSNNVGVCMMLVVRTIVEE